MAETKNSRKDVELTLSIDPEIEAGISDLQKEIIQDDLNNFQSVKKNDVNIGTVYVFDNGEKVEASVFIRNGLGQAVNFSKVPLCITDEKNNVLGEEVVELKYIGDIPARTARPAKIYFSRENIDINKLSSSKCKVVFNKPVEVAPVVKVQYEGLSRQISGQLARQLEQYLRDLPVLRKGELSINNYDINIQQDKIYITLVMRNGTDKKVRLEKLPITVYDADKNVIFSNIFELEKLEISPAKARVCNFVVNYDGIQKSGFNLNGLSIEYKQV